MTRAPRSREIACIDERPRGLRIRVFIGEAEGLRHRIDEDAAQPDVERVLEMLVHETELAQERRPLLVIEQVGDRAAPGDREKLSCIALAASGFEAIG